MFYKMKKMQRKTRNAFSLVEIMVAVVIIGIMAGAVTIKIGKSVQAAKFNRAKNDIATIIDAVESYQLINGRYPTNDEGLDNLALKSRIDPWGKRYQYNCPAQDEPFEIYTLGRDGREGGQDEDADVYSWQLNRENADG